MGKTFRLGLRNVRPTLHRAMQFRANQTYMSMQDIILDVLQKEFEYEEELIRRIDAHVSELEEAQSQ